MRYNARKQQERSMSKKKRPRQPGQQKQPHWQPISMLPRLSTHIDGMLEADVEQYETLKLARGKPHVLDDFTVNRIKQVFSTQKNDFWLFEEQLKRWQSGQLIDEQRAEVTRLDAQMRRLRENNTKVLALADELSRGTIEKVMAKSDEQLGLEFLMGMFNRE
jgi:hypothetical protein